MKNLKNATFLIIIILFSVIVSQAQNLGKLKKKATEIGKKTITQGSNESAAPNKETPTKSSVNANDKSVIGVWKIEGVIVTTEMEALKSQLPEQEKQYNELYKGSIWDFKKDGTVNVTYQKSQAMNGQTGTSEYEVTGNKLYMETNGMPSEFTVSFEEGQMVLTNQSPLNTFHFVFVKEK